MLITDLCVDEYILLNIYRSINDKLINDCMIDLFCVKLFDSIF